MHAIPSKYANEMTLFKESSTFHAKAYNLDMKTLLQSHIIATEIKKPILSINVYGKKSLY